MEIKVLGCSGAEFPGHYPTAFLVDGRILLDAGTLNSALNAKEQLKVKNIFITMLIWITPGKSHSLQTTYSLGVIGRK